MGSLADTLKKAGYKHARPRICLNCHKEFGALPPTLGSQFYCSVGCQLSHEDEAREPDATEE